MRAPLLLETLSELDAVKTVAAWCAVPLPYTVTPLVELFQLYVGVRFGVGHPRFHDALFSQPGADVAFELMSHVAGVFFSSCLWITSLVMLCFVLAQVKAVLCVWTRAELLYRLRRVLSFCVKQLIITVGLAISSVAMALLGAPESTFPGTWLVAKRRQIWELLQKM